MLYVPQFFTNSNQASFSYENSIDLDGVNEAVYWDDTSTFDITNNLSINVWIKVDSSTSLANAVVLGKYGASAGNDSYMISINGNKPNFWVSANGGATRKRYQINTDINDSAWHMITLTFASNTLKCYLDGSEATGGDLTLTQDNTVNTIFSGSQEVTIGSLDRVVWYFDGLITGLSIWDTAVLGDSDISDLYNSGAPNIEPGNDSFSANAVFHVDFNQTGDDATGGTGQITDSVSSLVGTPVNTESGDITADAPN